MKQRLLHSQDSHIMILFDIVSNSHSLKFVLSFSLKLKFIKRIFVKVNAQDLITSIVVSSDDSFSLAVSSFRILRLLCTQFFKDISITQNSKTYIYHHLDSSQNRNQFQVIALQDLITIKFLLILNFEISISTCLFHTKSKYFLF